MSVQFPTITRTRSENQITKRNAWKLNFKSCSSWRRRSPAANETEAAASDRTQRLGNLGLTTGYGNSLGSGYGSYGGSLGTYGKPSIDLGGVVLGTLIGIGALLILPKIINVFGGHGGGVGGGYYRSEYNFKHEVNEFTCFSRKTTMKLALLT